MSRKDRLQAKDKITHKMTRDGLVEINETKGEAKRVSQRGQDFNLQQGQPERADMSGVSEAGSANRHRTARKDATYSQVGNMSEPEAARPQESGEYRRYEGELAAQEREAGYQPEDAGAQQPRNPPAEGYTPGHHNSPQNNRQFIQGSGKRHKQQRTYAEQTDRAAATEQAAGQPPPVAENTQNTAQSTTEQPQPSAPYETPPGPSALRHEAAKPLKPHHTATDTATPEAGRPISEHRQSGLRFEETEQAAPRKKPAQRGTQYQRRFSEDAAKPGEAPTDEGMKENARAAPDSNTADPSKAAPDLRETASSDSLRSSKASRLQFTTEESASTDAAAPVSKKLEKARGKAAKTEAKLDKAQRKLPKKHRVKVEKTFNEETGKAKRRLHFESEVKSQRAHLKGPLPLRPVKAGANAAIGYAHKKIYQVEHENVGTQAAHKGELMAEGAVRSALRFSKTRPYRRVAKLEHKAAKANIKLSYHKALEDNPKLQSNLLSRMMQKRKIRKQYEKAAREAQRAAKAAKKTGNFVADAGRAVVTFIKRNPKIAVIIGLLALLIIIIMTAVSSCSNLAGGGFSSIFMSSYLAEDADIDNAELSYTEWETDLQMQINNAESDHPGYDEYRYNVDDIGHNPFELMAYLTARYQDFTYAGVEADLRAIFAEQYLLSFVEEIEVRYRTEYYTDDEGNEHSYEVPYNWYILNVNLTARSFTDVIAPRLDADQLEHYGLLMDTHGNRQYAMNPFDFDWLPYVSSYYGWRIHPISGAKDYHKGIDIAVAEGTEILAGHDGTVTFAGNSGDYGLVVVLEDGNGLVTKYAHCSTLLVSAGQVVEKGDVIAKVGNTGNSTGPHLHLEVIKDGQYLNPLFFAEGATGGAAPGTPGGIVIPEYPGAPMDDERFAAMMEEAQKHLGKPYVFGASGPNSFDCSGFVSYVLSHSIYPGFGRTNAQGLFNACTPVSLENAQPGDLIFFTGTYSAGTPVTHVGIYIGNGQMIHAGKPVQYSSINTSYWQSHYYAIGRLP